jgi:hypothetical protein
MLSQVQLSALKEKLIHVRKEPHGWEARTEINGIPDMPLRAVHVEMGKGWIPSVAYVELFGDGQYEQIEKVKGSGKEAAARAQKLLAKTPLPTVASSTANSTVSPLHDEPADAINNVGLGLKSPMPNSAVDDDDDLDNFADAEVRTVRY